MKHNVEKQPDTHPASPEGRLNKMRNAAQSQTAKRDIRTRQHLMERSFARATRYGFKRARWRRLWRVQIQEYLTSAIQNIMVLLSYGKDRRLVKGSESPFTEKLLLCSGLMFSIIRNAIDNLGRKFFSPICGYGHLRLKSCKKSDLGNRPILIEPDERNDQKIRIFLIRTDVAICPPARSSVSSTTFCGIIYLTYKSGFPILIS